MLRFAAPLLLMALAFTASAYAVLAVFYGNGALNDSYLFAWLLYDAPALTLTHPAFYDTGSYYTQHSAPLLSLFNLLGQWLPLSRIGFFALFIGTMHALVALAAWLCLRGALSSHLLAMIFTLLFLASTSLTNSLPLPHFEYFISAFCLLTLWAAYNHKPRIAWLCLLLLALTREDGALHFALLGGAALWLDRTPQPLLRQLTLAAFGLAIVTVGFALWLSAGDHYYFIYGIPFDWSHLQLAELKARLQYFITRQSTIWLPLLLTALWAWRTRQPLLLAALLANLPWLGLHLLARAPSAAYLHWYYAFPLLTTLLWPALVWQQQKLNQQQLLILGAILLAGAVSLSSPHLPVQQQLVRLKPLPTSALALEEARIQTLTTVQALQLENFVADFASIGLLPELFSSPAQHIRELSIYAPGNLITSQPITLPSHMPSVILFLPGSYDMPKVADHLRSGYYPYCYQLGPLPLALASHMAVENLQRDAAPCRVSGSPP